MRKAAFWSTVFFLAATQSSLALDLSGEIRKYTKVLEDFDRARRVEEGQRKQARSESWSNAISNAPAAGSPEQPASVAATTSTQSAAVSGSASNQVKSIRDNGAIAGNPSYLITCTSGRDKIVVRKDGKWTDSLGGTFSDRLWNLSVDEFAKQEICS